LTQNSVSNEVDRGLNTTYFADAYLGVRMATYAKEMPIKRTATSPSTRRVADRVHLPRISAVYLASNTPPWPSTPRCELKSNTQDFVLLSSLTRFLQFLCAHICNKIAHRNYLIATNCPQTAYAASMDTHTHVHLGIYRTDSILPAFAMLQSPHAVFVSTITGMT
jgi:hypothetical protein